MFGPDAGTRPASGRTTHHVRMTVRQRPLQENDRVAAVGQLDLSQPTPVLFAIPPHQGESDGSINRNYPSVTLEDPESVLAPFSHESVINIDGDWARRRIRLRGSKETTWPAEPVTPLQGMLESYVPPTGWLPAIGNNDELVSARMAELFDEGSVLWRVDVPVRTREDVPTLCTFVLASDANRAREILNPLHRHSLVIQQSSYSKAQIELIQASLSRASWPFYAGGQDLGPTGEMEVRVYVPFLGSELVQWVESAPHGLVALRPWIRRIM
jgi:hypothetical protein